MIDPDTVIFQKANESDAQKLTEIAFEAKKHWNYPEEYFEIWKDELTITSEYIRNNKVTKAVYEGKVAGFYSIVENKRDFHKKEIFIQHGYWLEHLFILPQYHKLYLGKSLIEHAKSALKKEKIKQFLVFADPFAKGFYEKIGADFLYESKSSIPNRLIPVYRLKV